MYSDLVKLTELKPQTLDLYLEKGWFRLGKNLFTTSFLTFKEELYDAFWLRIPLKDFEFSKSQSQILKRLGSFSLSILPFEMSEEKKSLFLKYRSSLSFEPAKDLDSILFSGEGESFFNTYNVCLYDNEKLIACGIFDLGEKSVQGIVSFYDPEYKKYSLGKALILLKIKYSKDNFFDYFYPGYVVPGYPRFDYKLDISKEKGQFFDLTLRLWRKIDFLKLENQPLRRIKDALFTLEGILKQFGYEEFKVKRYKFYDIGLDTNYSPHKLLTLPYFIFCFSNSQIEEIIIVYDTFDGMYKLVICHKAFQISIPFEDDEYSEFLIRPNNVILEDANPFNFVFALDSLLRKSVS